MGSACLGRVVEAERFPHFSPIGHYPLHRSPVHICGYRLTMAAEVAPSSFGDSAFLARLQSYPWAAYALDRYNSVKNSSSLATVRVLLVRTLFLCPLSIHSLPPTYVLTRCALENSTQKGHDFCAAVALRGVDVAAPIIRKVDDYAHLDERSVALLEVVRAYPR